MPDVKPRFPSEVVEDGWAKGVWGYRLGAGQHVNDLTGRIEGEMDAVSHQYATGRTAHADVFCAIGSFQQAMFSEKITRNQGEKFRKTLQKAVCRQAHNSHTSECIIGWNDAPYQRKETVISAFQNVEYALGWYDDEIVKEEPEEEAPDYSGKEEYSLGSTSII